jgi:hypothetical protein
MQTNAAKESPGRRASFFPQSEVPRELTDQIRITEEFQRLVEYQEKGFLDMELVGRRPKTGNKAAAASKERSGSRFSNGGGSTASPTNTAPVLKN